MTSVSVVVPVLDEADRIGDHLDALVWIEGLHEVIVVDGGSRDRTLSIALSRRVKVLQAPRGRAHQMNRGAREATGDVLLFLHADVRLPADALGCIEEVLACPDTVAGAFRTHTISDGRSTWIRPLLRLADLRSRYTRLPYGDQALFVRAAVFRRVGGFPEIELMEDVELARRLWTAGSVRTAASEVLVSGRRFLSRPLYYTVVVNVFPLLYRLGVPSGSLAGLYGDPR